MEKPRLGEEKAALREKRGRSRRAETFSHETLTLRSRPLLFCDPRFLVSITLNATTVSVYRERPGPCAPASRGHRASGSSRSAAKVGDSRLIVPKALRHSQATRTVSEQHCFITVP